MANPCASYGFTFRALSNRQVTLCALLVYAMARRFSPLFDASVHTERTRRGNLHPPQVGILARPSPPEREVCQNTFLRRNDAEEDGLLF